MAQRYHPGRGAGRLRGGRRRHRRLCCRQGWSRPLSTQAWPGGLASACILALGLISHDTECHQPQGSASHKHSMNPDACGSSDQWCPGPTVRLQGTGGGSGSRLPVLRLKGVAPPCVAPHALSSHQACARPCGQRSHTALHVSKKREPCPQRSEEEEL